MENTKTKNKKKILIVTAFPTHGAGSGALITTQAKSYVEDGHEVVIITGNNRTNFDKLDGVRYHVVPFTAETERRVRFHDSQGTELDMSTNSTDFSNFTLSEDTYEIAKKEFTIIPFTVDTTGSYYWWGREYFENQTEKTFTGASGFIVAKYLTIDSNGNLVDNSVYFEVGGIYEDKSKMEADINADYGV